MPCKNASALRLHFDTSSETLARSFVLVTSSCAPTGLARCDRLASARDFFARLCPEETRPMSTAQSPDAPMQPQENAAPLFQSTFKEGHQRFLAYAIEHSFVCGRRTPQDFIRHFTPHAIMKGLENQAGLRAAILVLTTG